MPSIFDVIISGLARNHGKKFRNQISTPMIELSVNPKNTGLFVPSTTLGWAEGASPPPPL